MKLIVGWIVAFIVVPEDDEVDNVEQTNHWNDYAVVVICNGC